MHTELTAYLRDNLLVINYAAPKCQAEVHKWWKVYHWQCSRSSIPLTSICCRTMLLAIQYSAALHFIIYRYKDPLFHVNAHSPMLDSQTLSSVHAYFPMTSVLSRQSKVSTRRSGDDARHELMQNERRRRKGV